MRILLITHCSFSNPPTNNIVDVSNVSNNTCRDNWITFGSSKENEQFYELWFDIISP